MVELEGLRFGYGPEVLFRDMDLKLEPGTIHGLLGINGAGKSSLLRLISGLLFPAAGRVKVLGHEPARRKPSFLSSLFLLPEELNAPGCTDQQYVSARAPFYPDFDRTCLERHLADFQVPRGRKLSTLSHGQQKKFFLSFGLATNASLLLLDEPTNGLDVPSKALFRQLVAQALETDRTIVIATHQAREVETLIDRIFVLHDGKVLFHANVAEVSARIRFTLDSSRPDEGSACLLHAEPAVGGFASVWRDANTGEGAMDLEMLLKAVIACPDAFASLFGVDRRP